MPFSRQAQHVMSKLRDDYGIGITNIISIMREIVHELPEAVGVFTYHESSILFSDGSVWSYSQNDKQWKMKIPPCTFEGKDGI